MQAQYVCTVCWCKISPDMYGYREDPEKRQKSGWYRDKDGIWMKYDGSQKHTAYAKKPDYMTGEEWAHMHLAQINQLMGKFLSKSQ